MRAEILSALDDNGEHDMVQAKDVRRSLGAMAAGAAAVIVFLLAPDGSVAQVSAFCVPFVLGAVLLGGRARGASGPTRGPLRLLWAAQATHALAAVVWFVGIVCFDYVPPFPSVVDVVYLVDHVIFAVFLAIVLRRGVDGSRVDRQIAAVDSLILATSVSAVLWIVIIEPNVSSQTGALGRLYSVLYPALTLIMLTLAARLAVSARFAGSAGGALLLLWVVADVFGDLLYGFQSANGTFQYAGAVTAALMVSYTALAALGAHPGVLGLLGARDLPKAPVRAHHLRAVLPRGVGFVVLLAAALTPIALAVLSPQHTRLMLATAAVTMALVTYRLSLLSGDLGEHRRLTVQLHRAVERLGVQERELTGQAEELQWMVAHDSLTGLGNRTFLARTYADLTGSPAPDVADLALVMLDLDDFKYVNDSLGHETGDALLVAVAGRLTDVVGNQGCIVRLGGDEFAVLLPHGGQAGAVALAQRVLESFTHAFHVLGHELHTPASIGITSGGAGGDLGSLMRSADLAMYAAKSSGKGSVRVYDDELLRRAQERLDLGSQVRQAVSRGELTLVYQPIVDALTGDIAAVEALARWRHPTRGPVSPETFIPAAETSGAMIAIGEWVLLRACRDVVRIADRRGRPMKVSVNVSVSQLQSSGFLALVKRSLRDSGLEPGLLTLEVTESLFMADDARSLAVLRDLHRLGVHLSIDDFGTGHSSLARLRTLPVSELKIDRSFVSSISSTGDCGPIITAVVAMARALGLRVVAEGVESDVQLHALRRLGCDYLQGFLLARPMPERDIDRVAHRVLALDGWHPAPLNTPERSSSEARLPRVEAVPAPAPPPLGDRLTRAGSPPPR